MSIADPCRFQDRRDLLARAGFHRTHYQPESLGLLIGNAELGGPVRADGLGFDSLYLSSLWQTNTSRGKLDGPRLEPVNGTGKVTGYDQRLDIASGIVETELRDDRGLAYRCELFASQAEPALLQMRLTNTGEQEQHWRLRPPEAPGQRSHWVQNDLLHIAAAADAPTPWACAIGCNRPAGGDSAQWRLAPGEVLLLTLACATVYEGPGFAERVHGLAWENRRDDNLPRRAHCARMQQLWDASAFIAVPDAELERLYYRCVYWLFSASGSRYALMQETPLAGTDAWRGVAFPYGFGWGVLAFTALGHPERARRTLELMFRPGALARNAHVMLERLDDHDIAFFMAPSPSPPQLESDLPDYDLEAFATPGNHAACPGDNEARSFGHQISVYGDGRMRRGHQRHIDGFVAAAAYRLIAYHPNESLLCTTVYPILRGCAIFWSRLLRWDDDSGGYITPPLHSVSENLDGRNVTDAVLSARWLLRQAARVAQDLQIDADWRKRWAAFADGLILPQNDGIYVEHLGQKELRDGSGYFGVRFPIYFGYPGWELARELDHDQVRRTFAAVVTANHDYQGMISFIASAFAASAAAYGDGETWVQAMRHNLDCVDPESGALRESEDKPYFHTSYAAFVCGMLSGLLQSDEDGDRLCPGVPDHWTEVAAWNLPAHGGRRLTIRRDATGTHVEPA